MRPGPPRSKLARIANRLAMPFGVLPFPFYYPAGNPSSGSVQKVFEEIYKANSWGSSESASGGGSELKRTEGYRAALLNFLERNSIQSMFDAPCGDLNWMPFVLREYALDYVGGDISDTALRLARNNLSGVNVRHFDICQDEFPPADVWQCRDALFHLSFADAWRALANAARSPVRLALLTTHRSRWLTNLDIETGGWRFLDLEKAPFHFPKPIEYLEDTGPGEFPRYVGVWSMDTVREVVSTNAQAIHSS